MIKIKAPAKINLTLEVLRQRNDGYHDIRSIVQAIDLCDEISFEHSDELVLKCDDVNWDANKSLIPKTISLLKDNYHVTGGVQVILKKCIPLLSGLGGDSSCAAATLIALSELWNLNLSRCELAELGSSLGSDVAFFVFGGGTALMEGRGEVVTLLPAIPKMRTILLVPKLESHITGKTSQLYAALDTSEFSDGNLTDELVETLMRFGNIAPARFYNVFGEVAFDIFENLKMLKWHFLEAGAFQVNLTGSGPTLFSLVHDKKLAEGIHRNLKKKGLEVFLTWTLDNFGTPEFC